MATNELERFGFDVTVQRFNFSTTPGDSLRSYFTSQSAKMNGSLNLAGISDLAVDALVDKILQAETRGELTFVPIQDRSFRSEKIAILVRNGRALPVAAAVLTERLVDALTSLALAAGQTESDDPTPMWPVQTARRRARP